MEAATRVSEATLESVKKVLRVDYDFDDDLILSIMSAARGYMKSYTGLTSEEIDKYPEMIHAFYCLCSDMYDNRSAQVAGNAKENPCVKQILAMQAVNYIC
ncbi:MAG: head-tail connector protein [Ruminococcus sp.]|nr:head-tail connector protein [Ruminococcus sp.]